MDWFHCRDSNAQSSVGHVGASGSTWFGVPLALCCGDGVYRLDLDRRVNEGEGGPAERLVLAEDKSQVAANGGLGHGNGDQHVGLHILLHVGTSDEAHA